MKKALKRVLTAAWVLTMALGLAACDASVTLASKTINGITLDIPSDLGAFVDQNGALMAANEDKTGIIVISATGGAQGLQPDSLDEDTFLALMLPGKENVAFLTYDNAYDCSGIPAVFASCNYVNASGVKVVNHVFLLFHDEATLQTLAITYSEEGDNSVKANIDTILKSVKVAG